MTPEEAFRKAFEDTMRQIWSDASVIILATIFILGVSAGLAIWLEWKLYYKQKQYWT